MIGKETATITNIIQTASTLPTSVTLSPESALELQSMGRSAKEAAEGWVAGKTEIDLRIPNVPGPKHPRIGGGPDGDLQFGIAIHRPMDQGGNLPMFFSDDTLTPHEELQKQLLAWVESSPGADTVGFLETLRKGILGNKKDWMTPLWLYRSVD